MIYSLLKLWMYLDLIAIILICFRKDALIIFNDLSNFVQRNLPYNIINFIIIMSLLPTTIIYTIWHFISKNK